jgi:hypothetical protein
MERSYGSFSRSIRLPSPVDEAKVSADLDVAARQGDAGTNDFLTCRAMPLDAPGLRVW